MAIMEQIDMIVAEVTKKAKGNLLVIVIIMVEGDLLVIKLISRKSLFEEHFTIIHCLKAYLALRYLEEEVEGLVEANWIIEDTEQGIHSSLQQVATQVKPITPLLFKKHKQLGLVLV